MGSILNIQSVNGNQVTVNMNSTQDPTNRFFPGWGSIDSDVSRPDRVVGWSICWIYPGQPPSDYRSVTSYTGLYYEDSGIISVIFDLVDESGYIKRSYDYFAKEGNEAALEEFKNSEHYAKFNR